MYTIRYKALDVCWRKTREVNTVFPNWEITLWWGSCIINRYEVWADSYNPTDFVIIRYINKILKLTPKHLIK